MGFFKKVRRRVTRVVKRAVTATATGGLSEVARLAGAKDLANVAESVFAPTSVSDLQTSAAIFSGQGSAVLGGAGPQGGGGEDVALGNVLGGIGGILGTVSGFGGPVGTVAQIGSGFLSGFLPAQGPMQSEQFPQSQFPVATQTMAAVPSIGGALAAGLANILAKISVAVGRNVSFRAAMIIVRRLWKTLQSPAAIATALGISVNELGHLLTVAATKGSSGRRMNAGNVKALRRAHRRIRSFHKLCGENDRLRSPRRRSTAKTVVVTGKRCD